ncbi:hypothetical protein QIU19_05705 [Capnocytophaga canimorsus]|nr:carboxypeptidase-like regulatory domain-containing protein [Capnocytophaga canimorsus]WGU69241.1 hypothetical protein QIU19_05705 [Capnocytophaga canimorsus]
MKKLLLILYFLSAFSYGQDFSISGKVVDSQTKEEMPFTEVALQGISNKSVEIGVVSDEKGHFRIKNLQKRKVFNHISLCWIRKIHKRNQYRTT